MVNTVQTRLNFGPFITCSQKDAPAGKRKRTEEVHVEVPPTSQKTPQKTQTLCLSLRKLVPDEADLKTIQSAVGRVHDACVSGFHVINLHLRRCLEKGESLPDVCDGNWVNNVFMLVTYLPSKGTTISSTHASLLQTMNECGLKTNAAADREGLTQALMYAARSFATVTKNNIVMHFRKRVLSYVRCMHPIPEGTASDKKASRLQIFYMAHDICRANGSAPKLTDVALLAWVEYQRQVVLKIAGILIDDKPLEWHLKASPLQFMTNF